VGAVLRWLRDWGYAGFTPGSDFDEYIWNDVGASGGGVSAFFNATNTNSTLRQPSWQAEAGIPFSLNDSSVGRGVPDVAANASPFSGYAIYTNEQSIFAETGGGEEGGTSAAAPLIAGFIAQVSASLGKNVGFLNPQLYAGRGAMCRKIFTGAPLSGFQPVPPPGRSVTHVTA
jgi:kumamolisin